MSERRGGFKKDPDELGALWEQRGKESGLRFWSGRLDLSNINPDDTEVWITLFTVDSDHEKAPTFRVMKGSPPPQQGGGGRRGGGGRGRSAPQRGRQSNEYDDDIPF